ncbi:hypothetical protein D9619_000273 [Psilocybe cf. subviscida]|uniref:Uncharacterized protein n=1 Tax=Psilocybe cf. subviscida TaxID=2480587 RepID=A0A8H5BD98_9AGAR|nr:hypothetical protein D9619_000273 [Psilocybe cf. subviscida]
MSCATEDFLPHSDIPGEAIIELWIARTYPAVPSSHPRANDPSFTGENLRPYVYRHENFLVIEPADERLPRDIDMNRSLQEILNDLSKFNQEPPFPSFPDPFSIAELSKAADEAFPEYTYSPDRNDADSPSDTIASEPHAVGVAGGDADAAVKECEDVVDPKYSIGVDSIAPPASVPQWPAAPTPIIGRSTPLPGYQSAYASPLSIPEELENDHEASGTAAHTPPPLCKSLQPSNDAPLPTTEATQAQPLAQPVTAVISSVAAIPAPTAIMPSFSFTFHASRTIVGPSTFPVAVMSPAPAQVPAQPWGAMNFRVFEEPIMYPGPPKKPARRAPRKTTGNSKGKAAGNSTRK